MEDDIDYSPDEDEDEYQDNDDSTPPEQSEENNQQSDLGDKARQIKDTADKVKKVSKLFEGGGAGTSAAGAGTTAATGAAGVTAETTVVAGAAGATTGAASAPVWGTILAVILLILIIIVIIMTIMGLSVDNNTGDSSAELPEVSLTKSGPDVAANGTDLNYTMSVSYNGIADDIIVTDPIPADAIYVSSNPIAKTLDASGVATTSAKDVKTVVWSLKDIQGTRPVNISTEPFNTSIYSTSPYLLPVPDGKSDLTYLSSEIINYNALGSYVEKYQPYLRSKAKNGDPIYVDPFISVIWSVAIKGIKANPNYWNCQDQSFDINAPCAGFSSGEWTVGYGVRVRQAADHLASDFDAVYGTGSSSNSSRVREVGQAVIDRLNTTVGQITNPATFPQDTVSSLVSRAKNGNQQAQQAVALLLMDQQIGAIAVAIDVGNDIAIQDNWRHTMETWGAYYRDNMQKFSNRTEEIARHYLGSSAQSFGNQMLRLTIKPLKPDIYLINKASAEVIGGVMPVSSNVPTGQEALPNDDTCNGYYDLTNPLQKNFGDPQCTMLAKDNPLDKDKLYNLFQMLDPDNAYYWVFTIVQCESEYNANAYKPPADGTFGQNGSWGLLQMGSINDQNSSVNAQYDRGDVPWEIQVSNAVNYNNNLRRLGLEWRKWGCAKEQW